MVEVSREELNVALGVVLRDEVTEAVKETLREELEVRSESQAASSAWKVARHEGVSGGRGCGEDSRLLEALFDISISSA